MYLACAFICSILISLSNIILVNAVASPRTLIARYPIPTTTTLKGSNGLYVSGHTSSSEGSRNETKSAGHTQDSSTSEGTLGKTLTSEHSHASSSTESTLIKSLTAEHSHASSSSEGIRNNTLTTGYPYASSTIEGTQNHSLTTGHLIPSGRPKASSLQNQTITAAPTDYPQSCRHCCLLGDAHCTKNQTWDGPPITLSDCVLWNKSCKGDTDAAAKNFFYNAVMLDEKPCWRNGYNDSYHCSDYEPAETLSAMSQMKDWMRGPECMSLSISVRGLITTPVTGVNTTSMAITSMSSHPGDTCCGNCIIEAKNVDVYYWPQPRANTACLDTVGDSVQPLLAGATTSSGTTYWGCTARHPKTTISTSVVDVGSLTLVTEVLSIITTEQLTSVNSLTFKAPLFNPWSPPDCVGATRPLQSSNASAQVNTPSKSIQVRGHSIIVPTSMSGDNGMPITVVSDQFTFTSPSIYANFHAVTAADGCGNVGSRGVIAQTLLAFAPGELSTIAGPLYNPVGTLYTTYSTRAFDFADFPCPPQSVMEENWYKPAAGNPYRPLIALPDKVKEIDPAWSACSADFFTGFDPPRTLVPASAMVPDPTSTPPVDKPSIPEPSPTPDPGPTKTALGDTHETSPAPAAKETPASKPTGLDPNLPDKVSEPGAGGGSKQQDSNPSKVTGDPNQQNNQPGLQPTALPGAEPQTAPDPQVIQPAFVSGHSPQEQDPTPTAASEQNPENPNTFNSPSVGNSPDGNSPSPSRSNSPVVGDPNVNSPSNPNSKDPDGNPNVNGPSNPSSKDPGSNQHDNPSNAAGDNDVSQSGNSKDGGQVIQLPTVAESKPTTAAGHVMQPIATGASIDGTIITPGAAPITISGTPVSMDTSRQVYVGGTPYQLPTPAAAQAVTLANSAVAVPLPNGVSIYGTTLAPGAPAVTAFGKAMSLDSSNKLIVADGAVSNLGPLVSIAPGAPTPGAFGQGITAAPTAFNAVGTLSPGAAAVTVNGVAMSRNSAGELMMDSKTVSGDIGTLSPNAPALTVSGVAVSLNSQGEMVVGTQHVGGAVGTLSPGASALTVNGVAVSQNSAGQIIAGSQTLTTAGASGIAVSLNSAGQMIVGSQTVGRALGSMSPGSPPLTIDGMAVSLNSAGAIMVGSEVLATAGTSNMAVSLDSAGNLVMGSKTIAVEGGSAAVITPTANVALGSLSHGGPALTVDGVAVSINSAGELMAGPNTIATEWTSAVAVSLDSAGEMVVGSQTFSVESSSGGLGQLIMGGLGPHTASSTSSSLTNIPTTASTNTGSGSSPTSKSGSEGIQSLIPWGEVIMLTVGSLMCLYI